LNLILLSVGAALGAAARYKAGECVLKYSDLHNFPLGTFLINTAGSLLLGVLCGLGLKGNPYVFFGDGFCGAFTTFSTFSIDSVQLIQGHARKKALFFAVLSVVAGMSGFFCAYALTQVLNGK
jgi:CrcB protein